MLFENRPLFLASGRIHWVQASSPGPRQKLQYVSALLRLQIIILKTRTATTPCNRYATTAKGSGAPNKARNVRQRIRAGTCIGIRPKPLKDRAHQRCNNISKESTKKSRAIPRETVRACNRAHTSRRCQIESGGPHSSNQSPVASNRECRLNRFTSKM